MSIIMSVDDILSLTADEAAKLRASGYRPVDYYFANDELRQTIDMIASGYFSPEEPDRFKPLIDNLLEGGDHYLLLADYASYLECQAKVEALYRDPEQWQRKAILNVANMGIFSTDRTIAQYAEQVWQAKPILG